MDKIIPRSIHYADLKPEAIENQVKLVRFTPQTNIQNSVPNDVIRFQLQGNGFYDPYSAYLHIKFSFKRPGYNQFVFEDGGEDVYKTMHDAYVNRINTDQTGSSITFNDTIDRKVGFSSKYPTDTDLSSTLRSQIMATAFEGGCLSIDDVSTNLYICMSTSVTQPRPGCEFKMLDRSAHSLITRLVIRSQGTEIERIEQYDIMAAMINDLIYSNEQAQLHSFEGFAGSTLEHSIDYNKIAKLKRDNVGNSAKGPRGRVGEVIFGWAFVAIDDLVSSPFGHAAAISSALTYDLENDGRLCLEALQVPECVWAITGTTPHFGQYCTFAAMAHPYHLKAYQQLTAALMKDLDTMGFYWTTAFKSDTTMASATVQRAVPYYWIQQYKSDRFRHGVAGYLVGMTSVESVSNVDDAIEEIGFGSTLMNINAKNADKKLARFNSLMNNSIAANQFAVTSLYLYNFRPGMYHFVQIGSENFEFVIPIYSGAIGVLMPDKKLLPLSILPLEVEFTLNNYAVICGASNTFGNRLTRDYYIKQMDLYAHMIFFEQEVHRSLEAIVAEHGIFMHMKSFYLSPTTTHSGLSVESTIPVNLHFKSINSVHLLFVYDHYTTNVYARKLHFVSHRLTSLQLRNGTDMIPSEPILIDWSGGNYIDMKNSSGTIGTGRTSRAFVEMLKSWNKMHDPMTDAALDNGLNYAIDKYAVTTTDLLEDFDYRQSVGTGVTLSSKLIDIANAPHFDAFNAEYDDKAAQFYVQNCIFRYITGTGNAEDTFGATGLHTAASVLYARPSSLSSHTSTTGIATPAEVAAHYSYLNENCTSGNDLVKSCMEGLNAPYVRLYNSVATNLGEYANLQYKNAGDYAVHTYLGQYGPNGKKIPLRPAVFFGNSKLPIVYTATPFRNDSLKSYLYGMSASWLNDRIQNFYAMVGRCQYSISLEGINLGSDNSILTGKKGMTPFDIMVSSQGKADNKSSLSFVFCRYDAVIMVRPDLVVAVLGK